MNSIIVHGPMDNDIIGSTLFDVLLKVSDDPDFTHVRNSARLTIYYKEHGDATSPDTPVEYYILNREANKITIYSLVTVEVNEVCKLVDSLLAA